MSFDTPVQPVSVSTFYIMFHCCKRLIPYCLILSFTLLAACRDEQKSDLAQTNHPQAIQFNPVEATIADVHAAIVQQHMSCVSIVQSYLDRIAAYDQAGPALHSIISLNPNALKDAQALDDDYQKNHRLKGPLHCVIILPKDNIDTAGMPTTAGAAALANHYPQQDAFIIQQIKSQGGIIIGKANMDEFAFGFTGRSSHRHGGQTKNAYDLRKGPGGSSSGTGTAVSASLALAGIGTDTGGSIRIPAAVQGLVGLRPSLRLISQDGLLPLSPSQDTAGPMCRTVTDCAILLDSLAGFDPSQRAHQRTEFSVSAPMLDNAIQYRARFSVPASYVPAADAALRGKRIGIIRALYAQPNASGVLSEDGALVNQAMERAIERMTQAGAIVQNIEIEDLPYIFENYSSLSKHEFKPAITDYLTGSDSFFQSFQLLRASASSSTALERYAQDAMSAADEADYLKNTVQRGPHVRQVLGRAFNNRAGQRSGDSLPFDVLAYPSMPGLAANLGAIPDTGDANRLSVFSGFPAISLPAASVKSPRSAYPMNINIEFMAREFEEAQLLEIAAAFEKIIPARTVPQHTPALLIANISQSRTQL